MLPELEQNSAKALAMNAHSFVAELADSLVAPSEPIPDLTGWLVHAMPGIYERAILTSPHLRLDQATSLCERFFPAFAEITRITSNAAGFSNPIKKLMFNAAFSRMFERESANIRLTMRKLWDQARNERADPLEYLSYALVSVAEAKTGMQLATDNRLAGLRAALSQRFSSVHALCR